MCFPYRAALLVAGLLLSTFCANAQPASGRLPNTLLWRISGNGLKHPSYLYGTIHLSDKRLFNFDEQLYRAMEETEGFAMELNPDEMVAYFINQAFDKLDTDEEENSAAPRLRDVLREEEYEKYSPALARKLKKPAARITTRDVIREKNRWVTDYASKGSMPTFVDAYLYNLARRQGKWVGGIEDLGDQIGALTEVNRADLRELTSDESTGPGEPTLNDMMTAYLAQDLSRIDEMINGMGEEFRDVLLIRRNVKMARRMDSLAAFRPMLFAVGAAHLPGDSGVINLLRGRGFKVDPVLQGKKLAASSYTIKEVDIPWQEVSDASGLYTVSMPGDPVGVKVYGLVDMQFFFDLFNMRGYMTTAIAAARDFRNLDSTADVMARSMFPGQRLRPVDVVGADGIRGREYTSTKGSQHMRLRIYTRHNLLYLTAAIAMKKESLQSPDVQRFISSFRINGSTARGPAAYPFTDSASGIQFTAPARMERNRKLAESAETEGWKITAWSGQDLATGSYIMLIVKGVEAGKAIANDTELLEASFESMQAQAKKSFTKQMLSLDGYPAMRIEGREKELQYRAITFVRGGKHYLLMLVADSLQQRSPGLQMLFSSLKLLPTPTASWQRRNSAEGHFTAESPAPWEPDLTAEEAATNAFFRAFDSASAVTYTVFTDTLSEYAWYRSDSVFWKEQLDVNQDEGDSVLYARPVRIGDLNGRELLLQKSGSNVHMRIRKLRHGNVIYTAYAQADRRLLFSEPADRFFQSFRPNHPAAPFNLYANKTGLLLERFASRDSLLVFDAYAHLLNASFGPEDAPLVRAALLKNYDTAILGGPAVANEIIGRKLAPLMDAATVQYLREQYPRLTGSREALKMTVLNTLAAARTAESYRALAALWTSAPPRDAESYYLYSYLSDSLALLQPVHAELLQLAPNPKYGALIGTLSKKMLDSGLISLELLREKEAEFLRASATIANAARDSNADLYIWQVNGFMDLLAAFASDSSTAAIGQYLRADSRHLRQHAVRLLGNKGLFDTTAINRLAAKKESRMEVYEMLREMGRTDVFPKRYLTQQAFSGSAMHAAASDEDEEPAEVTALATNVASYEGKRSRFYLYKVRYGSGETATNWLGVTGPYDVAAKELQPEKNLSQVIFTAEWKDDTFNYNSVFQQWLTTLSEDDEGDDDAE